MFGNTLEKEKISLGGGNSQSLQNGEASRQITDPFEATPNLKQKFNVKNGREVKA